jgi:hypothetical protein
MTATTGNRHALSIFLFSKIETEIRPHKPTRCLVADLPQIGRLIGSRSISPQDDAKAFDLDQSRPILTTFGTAIVLMTSK